MILSLDLGSKRMGAVAAPAALPLARVVATTVPVDAKDLTLAVATIAIVLDGGHIEAVLMEHAPLYMPPGKSPAAYQAMAAAHEVCSRLHERISLLCAERVPPIPVHTLARASWAHRVVPHTRGGITDLMANEGLRTHVEGGAWAALADQDQRDAAGTLVGYLLPAPRRLFASQRQLRDRRQDQTTPNPRTLPPEVREALRRARREAGAERRRALALARSRHLHGTTERLAGTCTCRPPGTPPRRGRHRGTCAVAPPPATRGSAVAAAAYVPITR